MNTPAVRTPAIGRASEPALRDHAAQAAVPPLYGGNARDALAWHLPKYLAEEAVLAADAEIEVPTWPGRRVFQVDFLVQFGGSKPRRIAIEIGQASTLKDHVQERRRDARLVASGAVDVVYRIAGKDLGGRISDVLFVIAAWERRAGAGRYLPDPFSPRGRTNLGRLAAPEARALELQGSQPAAQVVYSAGFAARRRHRRQRSAEPHLLIRRFDRRFPAAWEAYAAPAPLPVTQFAHDLNP